MAPHSPRYGASTIPRAVQVAGVQDESSEFEVLLEGVTEAVEEAVLDALFVANTLVGDGGRVAFGLPVSRVMELL